MRLALFIALFGVSGVAQDAQFTALQATLASLRERCHDEYTELRGAGPQLTVAKHQLRDWIESRLAQLPEQGNANRVNKELNEAVDQAKLREYQSCDQNEIGLLGQVEIHTENGALIVETGVGIDQCGLDDSAYVYEWRDGRWQRAWESEQNVYTEKGYQPQSLTAVHVSGASRRDRTRLVLTLGRFPWCTSNWQPIYYRLWRITPGQPAKSLLDRSEPAYVGFESKASVDYDRREALITFREGDLSSASQVAIRRFAVRGESVTQMQPVATGPRGFVSQWVNHSWGEVSWLTDSKSLEQWHEKLAGKLGEFIFRTRHCQTRPDVWQVGFETSGQPAMRTYFLVRWKPPFHFTMAGVNDRPDPGCTEEDHEADEGPEFVPYQY